jgi:D-sedoheptulose 7-phosphate isomerase
MSAAEAIPSDTVTATETAAEVFEERPADLLCRHLEATYGAITSVEAQLDQIGVLGVTIGRALNAGAQLLAAGNGGSAAHAQHLTSELVGRFDGERRPVAAVSLAADGSALTAIANDYGYDEVFARQVRALGRPGDVFVACSTSGCSPSAVRALEAANDAGLTTVAITGPGATPMSAVARHTVAINSISNAATQEAHQIVIHLLVRAAETALSEPHPIEATS